MNSRLYDIVRDVIKKNYSFTDEDVINGMVKWHSLLSDLNDFVDIQLDKIRAIHLTSKRNQNPCISKNFTNAINDADNKKFALLRTNCLLTKTDSLERLFCIPDELRPQDFNPKTKDFFAVCCGCEGWNDFTSKKHIDHNNNISKEKEIFEFTGQMIEKNMNLICELEDKYSQALKCIFKDEPVNDNDVELLEEIEMVCLKITNFWVYFIHYRKLMDKEEYQAWIIFVKNLYNKSIHLRNYVKAHKDDFRSEFYSELGINKEEL